MPYNGYPGLTVKADRIAIGIDSSLYVVNLNTKEKTLIFKRNSNMMSFPTFNANGTKITFTMSPFVILLHLSLFIMLCLCAFPRTPKP